MKPVFFERALRAAKQIMPHMVRKLLLVRTKKSSYSTICAKKAFLLIYILSLSVTKPLVSEKLLPTDWFFLIPGLSQSSKTRSHTTSISQHLSDSQLDIQAIFKLAQERQKEIEEHLKKKQSHLSQGLCQLPSNQLLLRIRSLETERKRQFKLWKTVQKHYQNSVKYQLQSRVKKRKIDPSLHKILLENFSAVLETQSRRQKNIQQVWKKFLPLWQEENALEKICPNQNHSDIYPIRKIQYEKWTKTYYLALYRFFRLLPVNERIQFLFKFHNYRK